MKSSSLGLMALAALGGATALYFTLRAPAPPATPQPTNALAAGQAVGARNPSPGRLPSISIAGESAERAAVGVGAGRVGPGGEPALGQPAPFEPAQGEPIDQVARLERRLVELEGRLAAATASAAGRPIGSPFPPGVDAPIPASKPAPTILPGTENSPDGPVLYDPGPPWPYNEGARGLDPPVVPGAGCLTCETGAASKK